MRRTAWLRCTFTELKLSKTLLLKTVTNWAPMRQLHTEFIRLHPELGLRATEATYRNFCRVFASQLLAMGVARRTMGARSPLVADVLRFDAAAFDLVTHAVQVTE